jgi:hypothetical protein
MIIFVIMKRKIKVISLKKINLEGIDVIESMYDKSIDRTKTNDAVGYDVVKRYFDAKNDTKKAIIDALNECDDFSVTFSSDSYWGDSCELETFKVEIESNEDFEKRREKQRIRNKELAERRKRKKEKEEKENEKKEYERLKKKFEGDDNS